MYSNPYYQATSIPNYIPTMPAPQMTIPKVTGEESARAYPIGPNSSVILMDTTSPLIWVVTTDASGYKEIRPYTVTPFTPEKSMEPADVKTQLEALSERIGKLEERIENNGQPYYGNAGKKQSYHERNRNDAPNSEGGRQPQGGNRADCEK